MRIQPNKYFKYVIQNTKNKKIPIDWNYNKIGNLFNITSGGTPSTKNSTFWDGDIPWIGPSNMNNSLKYIYHGERYLTLEGACILNNKLVTKNSIILSTRAPVGYVKKAANDLYTNQGCHSLDALNNLEVDNDFFYYYLLNNKSTLENFSSGTTFKELSKKSLHNIDVIFPCIEQQKNISSVLSFQENQIETIRELIKKIETRNQYYAEKILSGELRVRKNENGNIEFYNNTEWQDVILNGNSIKIPLLWKVKKITEIIKTKKGSSIKSELLNYIGNGIQYLRTNEVWDNSSVNKDKTYFDGETTSLTVKDKNEYIICFDGFNTKPHIGTVGMVTNNGEGICSGELHKIQEIDGISKYYVNVMMLKNSRFQDLICRSAEGSTVKHAGKHFKNIEEILIPIDEQELLNDIFKNQLHEIDSLKCLLEKEKLRFQWLLDNLLSGEYQVVDE